MKKFYMFTEEEFSAIIEKHVTVGFGNVITNDTIIKNNAIIKNYNYLNNAKIEPFAEVDASTLESCEVGEMSKIGVYSHLRPKSKIGKNVKIGNYVETKNVDIKDNSKASHLTYIGDAEIGTNCNISCGTIFCNYNGKIKQKSSLGNNVFVGSNVNIVAPVEIGDNAYLAAGSTITNNVPSNALAIARSYQINKENYVK